MNILENNFVNGINLADAVNKTDALLKELNNLIISQQLPPGYVFPNENSMCEMLSIGRGTLREVYKVMELNGFITRSKSGTQVNDIQSVAKDGTFDTSLLLSEEENIIEFLLIVEPEAARIAAGKATPIELDGIYDIMMKLEVANKKQNFKKIHEYNALYHQLIRDASHNPVLASSIYSSRKHYEEHIIPTLVNHSSTSIEFMDTCLQQHYNLYYALKTKNGEMAHNIMYEHFMTDLNYIRSLKSITFEKVDESITNN